MFLQYEGYNVMSTTDPLEAYKLATENHFDLLIADYNMNDMNGIELAAKCRELHNDISTILITGYWDKLSEAGDIYDDFRAILPKPLDIDRLLDELNAVKSTH